VSGSTNLAILVCLTTVFEEFFGSDGGRLVAGRLGPSWLYETSIHPRYSMDSILRMLNALELVKLVMRQ